MSLLRRIEQGQGKPPESSSPAPGGGAPPPDNSRLASIQARRVAAPSATPQAGTYFDLKTRVQNSL
ncbi:MAG: hypothetical protein FJZ96_14335, partial [Chloroflexi bacterium]|nr:hypothetical protein [Chloroflexota bacterium]